MFIDNKFFYVGSFTRWKFGEEGPKGYYKLTCNPKKESYKATFVENTMAQTFNTIAFGYSDKIFEDDEKMEEVLNRMDNLINSDVFDRVRFIFNIPKDVENPEATMNYLKEKYKFNDKVKLEIQHGYIEEKRERQKEEIQKENEKYSFIFDNSLPLEDKISRFIMIEYDKNIPTDKVKTYLSSSLNEILE